MLQLLSVVVLVGVFISLAGYLLTPGVGDAERRARRIALSHGGADLPGVARTHLTQALVAIEDRRFYEHGALDPLALGRATWALASGAAGDPGGSTITQQLARLLFSQRSAVLGPIQDTLVAFKLETRYSKNEILEMYLSSVYFGAGAYGAPQASLTYFHKPVWRLDWAEATMLAGLPQAPSALDPLEHFRLARQRQSEVLAAAVRSRILSPSQAQAAFAELRSLRS